MKLIRMLLLGWAAAVMLMPIDLPADEAADRVAMEKTMAAITKGFAEGDVDVVMQYHHPNVAKALNYKKVLVGRDAVKADMAGTFKSFKVEFIEHEIESLVIQGDCAIEQTRFAVRGTPKTEGAPWVFRGRAMVVYVRYAGSPTGWASLREMIQPATE
jgi:ketosteroid isomerase-like protein